MASPKYESLPVGQGAAAYSVIGTQSPSRKFLLTLAIGIIFGYGFAYITIKVFSWNGERPGLSLHRYPDSPSPDDGSGPNQIVANHSQDEDAHKGEYEVAQELSHRVRILCFILTTANDQQMRAKHVYATWGRRCTIILFISNKNDTELPNTIALNLAGDGENYKWGKTKAAFTYAYEHYRDQADWFLRADDDNYFIMENLRFMLVDKDANQPVYYGCRFKPLVKQGYMSGSAGYVLSKEAVKRFVTQALKNPYICNKDEIGSEDVEMGKCLENVNVKAGDSRDSLERARFFPFMPEQVLIPGYMAKDFWFWQYIYYPFEEGINCCSDYAISFHDIGNNTMYILEYMIYHLRPYGLQRVVEPLPLVTNSWSSDPKKRDTQGI